ncbi:MAG: PEP/pyruvate-binding domain-containing protein [Bacteroidota bacterium]
MELILHTESHKVGRYTIGGKAKNLFRLIRLGMKVPAFAVIPSETLWSLVPEAGQNGTPADILRLLDARGIPGDFITNILSRFYGTRYFAVRSSGADEDGAAHSFAGQFESHLFVTAEQLEEKIKSVWRSAFSQRVQEYRRNNGLKENTGIAVIIQEMIAAESAGVAFGIHPTSGNPDEKMISAVFGLGEGLVSGELNADHYILNKESVTAHIAEKTHQVVLASGENGGTVLGEVEKERQNRPVLDEKQVREIGKALERLYAEYGQPQDIEFAFSNGELFLLQTRPVTGIHPQNDKKGEYIVWDNSNIIESYPGVTTPLTFSFITTSYEGAYRLFCSYMGVSQRVIRENRRVFANTLGLINGRVYYNLKTWYHMLAMLPGYSINARFMEKMMGVKERFDIPNDYRLSKAKAWLSIIRIAVNMYFRFLSLPRKRKQFMRLFKETITVYKHIDYEQKNADELMKLYLGFERRLLNEWKAPLLNDFFTMIWFGLLQKTCERYRISRNPNIHNDLLCGSSDIISTQPIHRSIALATAITADTELRELFRENNEQDIWRILGEGLNDRFAALKKEIDRYIADFGERCIGELKLETISYTQDPSLFIKVLRAYVESGITTDKTTGKIEEELRASAERELEDALRFRPFKKWKLKRILRKARELVSSRENLRYERTRAFGIVRELFSHIGKRFATDRIIDHERDIFYLTKEEIFSFIEGTSVTQNLRALVALRKEEFERYRQMPPPSERFATYGSVYFANDFFSTEKTANIKGDLKGIGCCPGKVRGKVQVILDPGKVASLNGDILVTSSTDPGWVTLFPSASGIIVERGSLLSHSAIVSREMGKPCIVSVSGLLKTLRTGDEVEMDGSTGEIKIIKRHG